MEAIKRLGSSDLSYNYFKKISGTSDSSNFVFGICKIFEKAKFSCSLSFEIWES